MLDELAELEGAVEREMHGIGTWWPSRVSTSRPQRSLVLPPVLDAVPAAQ